MLIAILMTSAVFTYLATQFGWRVDCVLSGSMSPALTEGSVVITRPVDTDTLEIGDIITFHDNSSSENTITHRVIGVWHNSPVYFQTKGDACTIEDPFTVAAKNVDGKLLFSLPFVGYLFTFLKTSAGFITAIVIPTIILFVLYIVQVVQEIRKRRMDKAGEAVTR